MATLSVSMQLKMERDRLGRSGWRPASQSHRPYRSHHSVGLHAWRKCFRPEAENGGRDARAPQLNCMVTAKEVGTGMFRG